MKTKIENKKLHYDQYTIMNTLTVSKLAIELAAIYENTKNFKSVSDIWVNMGTIQVAENEFYFEIDITNRGTTLYKYRTPVATPSEVGAVNHTLSQPYIFCSKCKLSDTFATGFDRAASGDLIIFGGDYYDSEKPLNEWYDNI